MGGPSSYTFIESLDFSFYYIVAFAPADFNLVLCYIAKRKEEYTKCRVFVSKGKWLEKLEITPVFHLNLLILL